MWTKLRVESRGRRRRAVSPLQRHGAGVCRRGGRLPFVWTADLLPNGLAAGVEAMIEEGIQVIRRTMENRAH